MAKTYARKASEPQAAPAPDKKAPAAKLRLGRIACAIWQNDHETQGTWYSMSITRAYKDKNGQWQNSTSFGREDLLVVAEICRLAFLWIQKAYNTGTDTVERQPGDDSEPLVDCPL